MQHKTTQPPCGNLVLLVTRRLTWLVAGSFWLKNWADRNTKAGANPEFGKYIGIYFVFGVGAAALTVVQTLILWIFCSIEVCVDSQ